MIQMTTGDLGVYRPALISDPTVLGSNGALDELPESHVVPEAHGKPFRTLSGLNLLGQARTSSNRIPENIAIQYRIYP